MIPANFEKYISYIAGFAFFLMVILVMFASLGDEFVGYAIFRIGGLLFLGKFLYKKFEITSIDIHWMTISFVMIEILLSTVLVMWLATPEDYRLYMSELFDATTWAASLIGVEIMLHIGRYFGKQSVHGERISFGSD